MGNRANPIETSDMKEKTLSPASAAHEMFVRYLNTPNAIMHPRTSGRAAHCVGTKFVPDCMVRMQLLGREHCSVAVA
jgi:hypothetical protein